MTTKTSTASTADSTPETPTAVLTPMTPDEVVDTLTGFDELAITNKFGADLAVLNARSWNSTRRALIFVLFTRLENGPKDAYKAAMSLTVGQLDEQFGADDGGAEADALSDEAPESESGKDD